MNKQELIEKLKTIDGGYGSRYYIAMGDVFELVEQLDEPQPIKSKDIIARIKSLDVGIQEVWLNKILKELGSDYGSLKYRAGYEQGRFDCAMEREKVTVPQFVADWIEKIKKELSLREAMSQGYAPHEVDSWLREMDQDGACLNQELFARAWLDGYEVEKEKRYLVKMKGISSNMCYLNRVGNKWIIAGIDEHTGMNIYTKHTKKELEDASFGWVFDCPGIEIEVLE